MKLGEQFSEIRALLSCYLQCQFRTINIQSDLKANHEKSLCLIYSLFIFIASYLLVEVWKLRLNPDIQLWPLEKVQAAKITCAVAGKGRKPLSISASSFWKSSKVIDLSSAPLGICSKTNLMRLLEDFRILMTLTFAPRDQGRLWMCPSKLLRVIDASDGTRML